MNESAHLEQFNGKCSVLTTEDSYRRYFRGQDQIGRTRDINDPHGSMYVSTSDDIDKALKNCNGDISKLESSLGFQEGHFGDGPIIRVDINNPEEYGLRVANGKEAGANEYFNTRVDENGNLPNIQHTTTSDGRWAVDTDKTDPGELAKLNGQYIDQNGTYHPPNTAGYDGKTSGGMSEAVINQVPNNSKNVSYTKIDGFKRGESSDLKTSQIKDGYSQTDTPNKINSQSVASEKGGGARAPNGESASSAPKSTERGTKPSQADNPPFNQNASVERGQKPSSTEDKPQSKASERGQKPTESIYDVKPSNPTIRGEKPQEAPQNAPNTSQTQRGTLPDATGSEDSNISANTNSAKSADEASKSALEQAAQNIAPKPNGMGM